AVEVARLGVWMFNVHAIGGGEMMRKTVENVREVCERENLVQPKIIAVTVLTSADRETLKEVGIETEMHRQVLKLAQLASKCDLDGVVASPLEVREIRENVGKEDFLIVTPGIRNSSFDGTNRIVETSDDQKRVMTAKDAVAAGADYLVIGRPILQAEDRIAAARKIIEEIV
ncbi:MAG TPA: orotidine-5'-phosphate decarboxylase, partial [Pyrinomonadaceae bacterium]|nr:orotidine-5'-phosphate decarboxylase [Pyrinomonadaceae bacterium]